MPRSLGEGSSSRRESLKGRGKASWLDSWVQQRKPKEAARLVQSSGWKSDREGERPDVSGFSDVDVWGDVPKREGVKEALRQLPKMARTP